MIKPKVLMYEMEDGTKLKFQAIGGRKLTQMMKALPIFGGQDRDEKYALTKKDPEADYDFSASLVCTCSVDPVLTKEDPPPEGQACVEWIPAGEFTKISKKVLRLCGLGEVTAEVDPTPATEKP